MLYILRSGTRADTEITEQRETRIRRRYGASASSRKRNPAPSVVSLTTTARRTGASSIPQTWTLTSSPTASRGQPTVWTNNPPSEMSAVVSSIVPRDSCIIDTLALSGVRKYLRWSPIPPPFCHNVDIKLLQNIGRRLNRYALFKGNYQAGFATEHNGPARRSSIRLS